MIRKVKESKGGWFSNCCSAPKVVKSDNPVYGIGVVGALVYFISTATGFWDGVIGVVKALLWPGFLIYEVLKNLNL